MKLKRSVHACVSVSPRVTWNSLYHAHSWDPLQPYPDQNLGMGPGIHIFNKRLKVFKKALKLLLP